VTRVLSGLVLLGAVGAAALRGPSWLLLALAAGVAALAIREYGAIAAAAGAPVPPGATMLATVAICVTVAMAGSLVAPVLMAIVIAQATLALAWSAPQRSALPGAAAAVFGPLYVGLPLGSLVAVHAALGPAAALVLIGIIALSDTAQYYGGRLLGRRPLAPVISPKKTVEGALAGLLAGTIGTAAIGAWLWPGAPVWFLLALGAALVMLGIAGDLFESLLKRSVGVKDSSGLIPGHGGVLDRIDAVLFAAPVYYVVLPYALRSS
jgi:phosphatidate cytidylyltransferase